MFLHRRFNFAWYFHASNSATMNNAVAIMAHGMPAAMGREIISCSSSSVEGGAGAIVAVVSSGDSRRRSDSDDGRGE